MILILPYNKYSQSVRDICNCIGWDQARRALLEWKKPHGIKAPFVVNWGHKWAPNIRPVTLNQPSNVDIARNKLSCFRELNKYNLQVVPFTESKEIAEGWIREGHTIYARTLYGQEGKGIQVIGPGVPVPKAPLYTRRIPAKEEWRVHVFRGKVIDYAKKLKKVGREGNRFIRSHANGYIFARLAGAPPDIVVALAKNSIECLGLNFGAVDILHSVHYDKAYVLEVNTAPGLDNHGVSCYSAAIKEAYNEWKTVA